MGRPKDTPKEMFHADVDDGGLGILELQKRVPLKQEARLTRLMRDEDPAVAALTQTGLRMESIEAALPTTDSVTPHSIAELRVRQGDRLQTTADGAGLKTVRQCGGHGILTNGTLPLRVHFQRQPDDNQGKDAEVAQWTGHIL